MAEFLNPTCPVCLRSHPISVWERIVNSETDYLGIVQRSGGRGQFEVVGQVYQPEQLDWVKLDGFDISVKREPAPFEVVRGCFMRALSRRVDRGWLTDAELRTIGLIRLGWESLGIRRTMSVISQERVVTTKTKVFQL